MQGSLKAIAEKYKDLLENIDWESLDYEKIYKYISSFKIDYSLLRKRNLERIETDDKFAEKRATLNAIVKTLNDVGIKYEFCCSFSLFLYGIVDDFDDFDIVLDPDEENIAKAKEALEKIGIVTKAPQKENFSEEAAYFNLVINNGMTNDVFGGFYFLKIEDGVIIENFDYVPGLSAAEDKVYQMDLFGYKIPVTPPEASACFYREMANWQKDRDIKTLLILIYLANYGLEHPEHFPEWYLDSLNPMICSIFEYLPMSAVDGSQLSILKSDLGPFGELLEELNEFLKSLQRAAEVSSACKIIGTMKDEEKEKGLAYGTTN